MSIATEFNKGFGTLERMVVGKKVVLVTEELCFSLSFNQLTFPTQSK